MGQRILHPARPRGGWLLPEIFCAALAVALFAPGVPAAIPALCAGGHLPVGTFKLMLVPAQGGGALPLESANLVQEGDRVKYEPGELPPAIRGKARIALVLVPAPESTVKDLQVLDAKPAKSAAQWTVPTRSSVVGVVFGPRGLDVKKVSNLMNKDPELVPELATYAHETATVNALISTLSQYDASRPGSEDLNAVLRGFSTRYGVMLPRLNTGAPADQQAQQLIQALMPSVSNYNPLASGRSLAVEQSAGLAASLAGLFYGTPVGLAAGGAELFENLRAMVFPNTDFRAAFIESAGSSRLKLCSQNQAPAPRARLAYLWMLRIPDAREPSVSLASAQTVPLGAKSTVKVTCATHEQLRLLPRARGWRLVSAYRQAPVPVAVSVENETDTLSLDLTGSSLPAGLYHLAALWDWQPLVVRGAIEVRPFGDLLNARLTPESEDRLVEGSGRVQVKLAGADFEFVDRAALAASAPSPGQPQSLPFTLPRGPGAGEQLTMETSLDTSALPPGGYRLLLTQPNGESVAVPVTILPPGPVITGKPLRVNLGQPEQQVTLRGTGLDRIERLDGEDAVWTLAPPSPGSAGATERKVTVRLGPAAKAGEMLSAHMTVQGISQPVELDGLALVAAPRPAIESVDESFPGSRTVSLEKGEIPAGVRVSFALHLAHVDARPSLQLACADPGDARQTLRLSPGDRNDSAQLDFAGAGILFLSLDPGAVGQSDCELTAAVSTPDAGVSDPSKLGRIVRLPEIEKFSLTSKRLGRSLYEGILTGQNLQMISSTGWNSKKGFPVRGIPTPVAGSPGEQTLQIELPWPPPAPQSPVYIWLRGEDLGRETTATY